MADRSGYIGRAPGDSSVTVARQTFSPTGVTTDFTFASGYTVGYLDLFLNGTKLIEGVDYNATDTSTISLVSAAINGDVLEGVAYKAFNLGDANRIGIQSTGTLIGNVNTLNFIGAGNTFALNGGIIDVSITGAGGTWSNYDTNTGITTTKKVKISNNLEVTGVTTSTGGFVGALTGNASGSSGSCTGNSATATVATNAQGLTGTPDIAVRNITGVAATFTGVLTYEDVTNIDSIGIITAQSDVVIADKIIHLSDTNTAIRFPAADTFTVETGGTEAYRVDSSQRLLVGTTAAYGSDDNVAIQKTDAGARIGLQHSSTGQVTADEELGIITFYSNDGDLNPSASIVAAADLDHAAGDKPGRLVFSTTADGASSPTERLRITSAGLVGIGAITPSVSYGNGLHIAGGNAGLKLQNTNNGDWAYIEYADESNTTKFIQGYRDQSGVYGIRPGTSLNATPGISLTSAGLVGINSTSPGDNLSVSGGSIGIYNTGNNHGNVYFYKDNVATAWFKYRGDTNAVIIGTNAGDKVTIDSSGNLTATGNVTAYSDISLKENIETIPNALDKVLNLRGVEFDRIDKEDNPHEIGVIAQEVEQVIPEVVLTNEEGIKSVAYGNLVGLLIESIKELKAEVNDLKAQVEG